MAEPQPLRQTDVHSQPSECWLPQRWYIHHLETPPHCSYSVCRARSSNRLIPHQQSIRDLNLACPQTSSHPTAHIPSRGCCQDSCGECCCPHCSVVRVLYGDALLVGATEQLGQAIRSCKCCKDGRLGMRWVHMSIIWCRVAGFTWPNKRRSAATGLLGTADAASGAADVCGLPGDRAPSAPGEVSPPLKLPIAGPIAGDTAAESPLRAAGQPNAPSTFNAPAPDLGGDTLSICMGAMSVLVRATSTVASQPIAPAPALPAPEPNAGPLGKTLPLPKAAEPLPNAAPPPGDAESDADGRLPPAPPPDAVAAPGAGALLKAPLPLLKAGAPPPKAGPGAVAVPLPKGTLPPLAMPGEADSRALLPKTAPPL